MNRTYVYYNPVENELWFSAYFLSNVRYEKLPGSLPRCFMSIPCAVLTADVHYDIQTLSLADAAMRMAIEKANALNIPIVVAGDLHNTKANLRAECINAMIETFKQCKTDCYVLRGNHDAINEKSEEHALNFLAPYVTLVDSNCYYDHLESYLIPYQHDVAQMRCILKSVLPGTRIIMHQGLQSALAGEYIQDKSAITHGRCSKFPSYLRSLSHSSGHQDW